MPPWVMTAVVVLAILWLTLAPKPLPDNDVHWFEGADKVVHGCMFGGLFFVMGLDWVISGRKLGLPVGMALAGVCVAFGGGIELVQGAMDMGRGCDVWDFVADTAGVALSLAVTPVIVRWLIR